MMNHAELVESTAWISNNRRRCEKEDDDDDADDTDHGIKVKQVDVTLGGLGKLTA